MSNSAETSVDLGRAPIQKGIVHGASRGICLLAASVLLAFALALWSGMTAAQEMQGLVVMKLGLSAFCVGASALFMRLALPVRMLFNSQQNM